MSNNSVQCAMNRASVVMFDSDSLNLLFCLILTVLALTICCSDCTVLLFDYVFIRDSYCVDA